jgi:hypothetical protein
MTFTRSLPLALLALIAGGASFLAWYEYAQVRDLRALGMTPDDRGRLQKAVWDAQKQVHQLEGQLSAAHVMRTTADDVKPGADNRAAMGQMASDYLGRLDDPEVRRLMDLQRLANLNRQYGQFFKDARLTPQQIAQFQQLMLERQRAETDVLIAASQQGINPMSDPQEFRQMVRNAQADVDKQIQGALGTDTFGQFHSYQQTANQRGVVNQLQQDLSYSDSPLTDAQKEQMNRVLAQTNQGGGAAVNAKTIAAAQGVLSQGQMQALQNIQQLQQVNGQLQNALSGRRR